MSKSQSEKKRKAQAKAQDKKPKKVEAAALTLVSARAPEPEAVRAPARAPQAATPQAAFAGAVATIEGSLKAMRKGAVQVNRKLIEIAQANVNSSLEHAKEMADAKNPMAAMRLHINYWYEQMGVFTRRSQEFRALQAELVGLATAPIRAHLRGDRVTGC
jgi:hypothetical protein